MGILSSPLAPAMSEDADSLQNCQQWTRRRPQRKRRRCTVAVRSAPNMCLLFSLLLVPHAVTSQQHQHRGLSPQQRNQRTLQDGITECGSCNVGPDFICAGTSVADEHCKPCATGQTWWPCNIQNECYCKDLAAEAAEEAAIQAGLEGLNCEIPLCEPGESGTRLVPFTRCEQYVRCTDGVPGNIESCSSGQAYSTSISSCNVKSLVDCPKDPTCPPTATPTVTPETGSPTRSPLIGGSDLLGSTTGGGESEGVNAGEGDDSGGGAVTPGGVAATGGSSANGMQSPPVQATPPQGQISPDVLEGMYVLDAHMAANKILLTRELLTSPGGGGGHTPNDFSYTGFRSSLRRMITTPIANSTFYIGNSISENGRAYGLVNIAAFLSMSYEDSIRHGSCDEVNSDVVGGILPISNSCGQYGMSYEDLTCEGDEAVYDCQVDTGMIMSANPINIGRGRGRNGGNGEGSEGGVPPKPFYCGPRGNYGGFTGHWDYVSGMEVMQTPVQNAGGRQDVEGCCWWGRGAIQLRGTCAYGKLNYHLGKRAADEGRSSAMFPDVDFCMNPQAICSHERYPDLKWIAGMFRWITEVQTYNTPEFNYYNRLMAFVDGGLKDWSFVHGVSGIVTQGCHAPPCMEGAEFDGVSRKATFIKTLKLLGLKVKDTDIASGSGSNTVVAGSRRLGN